MIHGPDQGARWHLFAATRPQLQERDRGMDCLGIGSSGGRFQHRSRGTATQPATPVTASFLDSLLLNS